MKESVLEIQNLSHSYENGNYILENIDLVVKCGEIISIIGASGCGKTTLLRIIAGLEKQSRGTVEINHSIVSDANFSTPPENRNIGLVVQDRALFPHLTIYENVNFGIRNLSSEIDIPLEYLKLFKVENLSKKYLAKGLFIYSEVISAIFYLIKNKLLKDQNKKECMTIINSSEKWLKNSHMINEIFGEGNYDENNNFELKIDFDFPAWLSKSHLPLSQFKENSTYKLFYDTKKINTLRDRLKSRFGSMSQRAFATYLSQTKDGQFETIHKQFKKII